MAEFYHTCPDCGANLDPGEHCDCEKINKYPSQDRLIIGFDNSIEGDHTCFTVGRIRDGQINILNTYYDDEANEMYSKLITQAPEGLIKNINYGGTK